MSMRLIREMRERSEDEIEVLGSARRENDSRKWLWIGAALLFVLVLGFCVWKLFFIRPVEEEGTLLEEPAPEISVADSTSLAGDERPYVTFEKDSINDVVLAIYALHQLKAELSLALPDTSDTSVYFVLQAADIRRDNLQILGDFVLRGKQLARGKRKTGFCAIRNGQITLGTRNFIAHVIGCRFQVDGKFKLYGDAALSLLADTGQRTDTRNTVNVLFQRFGNLVFDNVSVGTGIGTLYGYDRVINGWILTYT